MRNPTLPEIEQALTDARRRLQAARDRDDLEAEIVYEAQQDRLLGMWQAHSEHGRHKAGTA